LGEKKEQKEAEGHLRPHTMRSDGPRQAMHRVALAESRRDGAPDKGGNPRSNSKIRSDKREVKSLAGKGEKDSAAPLENSC